MRRLLLLAALVGATLLAVPAIGGARAHGRLTCHSGVTVFRHGGTRLFWASRGHPGRRHPVWYACSSVLRRPHAFVRGKLTTDDVVFRFRASGMRVGWVWESRRRHGARGEGHRRQRRDRLRAQSAGTARRAARAGDGGRGRRGAVIARAGERRDHMDHEVGKRRERECQRVGGRRAPTVTCPFRTARRRDGAASGAGRERGSPTAWRRAVAKRGEPTLRWACGKVNASHLMEPAGIEPATSALQRRRSPN